jgi:drug/metabolite transporter (DMT)-like permease
MSALVKLAGELPTVQKVFFRNSVAVCVSLFMILTTGGSLFGAAKSQPSLLLRSSVGLFAVICNYYAVDHLVLSDAAMLNKIHPFFTILFSALVLREGMTKVHVSAFLLAFAGCLLIIKPSFSFAALPALTGLAGGITAGLAYGMVRLLSRKEKPYTIIFYFSAFSLLAVLPVMIRLYRPMTSRQLFVLLLSGVMASAGQFGITFAYRFAPSREISIFNYSDIVFSACYSFFFFGALPDFLSLLGYVVILTASFILFSYNRKRYRADTGDMQNPQKP